MSRFKINVPQYQITNCNAIAGSRQDTICNPIRWAVRDTGGLDTDLNCEVMEDQIRINTTVYVKTPWRVRTKLRQWRAGKTITPFSFWIEVPEPNVVETAFTVKLDPAHLHNTGRWATDEFNPFALALYVKYADTGVQTHDPRVTCECSVGPEFTYYDGKDGKHRVRTPKEVAEVIRIGRAGHKIIDNREFEFPYPKLENLTVAIPHNYTGEGIVLTKKEYVRTTNYFDPFTLSLAVSSPKLYCKDIVLTEDTITYASGEVYKTPAKLAAAIIDYNLGHPISLPFIFEVPAPTGSPEGL